METVTLILPLEATTVILLPHHLSTISATPRIQLRSLNAKIKGSSFHLDCFLQSRSPLWWGRHKCLTVTDGHHYPNSASWYDNREPSNRQQKQQWSDSGATSVQFRIVYILSGPDMKFTFFLFSILILDNFRFSLNFEMGWFRQHTYFGQVYIQSEFWKGLIPNSDFGEV